LIPHERLYALYALLFLSPAVPLVFMGEEWAANTPFLYFCDFAGELGDAVQAGRRKEFSRFAAFNDAGARREIPDPLASETFLRSRLDWNEMDEPQHGDWVAFVSQLIACRRRELVPLLGGMASGAWQMFGEMAFAITWPLANRGCWRVEVNLGEAAVRMLGRRGRLIYAHAAETGETLPPDSIRVTLDV
ncbi:MAG: DUF3459 domain-containing protein, partial [Gammaproteobacteria bacterium]